MPTIQEKIDAFARRIQIGEVGGAHSTIKQELVELCRDYAMSCKPDIKEHTCRMNDGECVCECYNTALKKWEENIKGKIN